MGVRVGDRSRKWRKPGERRMLAACQYPDTYPELPPFPPEVRTNFTHNFSKKTARGKYFWQENQ